MKWLKLFLISLLFIVGLLLIAKSAKASQANVELRSTTGQNYRCYASSHLMQDNIYTILVSCQDLLYPAGESIYAYIMWATPTQGGNPIKLGALGLGRATFRSAGAFSSLFVTTEINPNVKTPAGTVVMRGGIQPLTFLERPTTPTPTPEGEIPEEEEVAAEQLSTGQRLVLAFKRAGVVILLALVAVVGLVFVLTRPRT